MWPNVTGYRLQVAEFMLTSYTDHGDKFSLLKGTGLSDAELATFHTGGAHTHTQNNG